MSHNGALHFLNFSCLGNLMESIFSGGGNAAIVDGEDIVMETEDMD